VTTIPFAEDATFMGSPAYLSRLNEVMNNAGDGIFPFSPDDATAGVENEFQTAVEGSASNCDLPLSISSSKYYRSLKKRVRSGEISKNTASGIDRYLSTNASGVWENSWVRIELHRIGLHARMALDSDMKTSRDDPSSAPRSDADSFILRERGLEILRVPVSYMLKLCLADAAWAAGENSVARQAGIRALLCFINDNTSPEVSSFFPVRLSDGPAAGTASADETLLRFLLIQALAAYANTAYGLRESGQEVKIYFSPHPPMRQKRLNEAVSDYFYRELFMNPCLSGWDRGEDKHAYMNLCHKVLSRSHLAAASKLKDAGIINNGHIVMPNLSNISLANNGTHISLGSALLTGLLADASSGFTARDEKYTGDLAVKISEHFLPLFTGTYTADPYRLSFGDFHPENALGFLPHELDFTHLRMLWRRWKKKANLRFMGKGLTPFGHRSLDGFLGSLPGLEGDYVDDFRLIDYPVCLLSTDDSPAFSGMEDSTEKLKSELELQGVFDSKMSLYLFYKLRRAHINSFTGFEARHYSLFSSLLDDMAQAVSMQCLITALAMRYILSGYITHRDIPDIPFVESERRQVVFGSAIGIPTFFVKKDTPNRFIMHIIASTKKTRMSARYPGYIRVQNTEYLKALLGIILRDGPDLIERFKMSDTMRDLASRIEEPFMCSCASRLKNGILQSAGVLTPFDLSAEDFNIAAEKYYRETLRLRHIDEALLVTEKIFLKMQRDTVWRENTELMSGGDTWPSMITTMRNALKKPENLQTKTVTRMIHAILHSIEYIRRTQGI
jgi:hypothetical protein